MKSLIHWVWWHYVATENDKYYFLKGRFVAMKCNVEDICKCKKD